MANTCASLGPQSYTTLQAASKEGTLKLPRSITLKTSSGQTINIGAGLTTPSSKKLMSRLPLLSVRLGERFTEVVHLSAKSDCWQKNNQGNVFGQEELNHEEVEALEELDGELETEEEEEVIKSNWVQVQVPPAISKADLLAYFSSYGVVESVQFPSEHEGHAAVIFSTTGSVQHCLSQEHYLGQECSDDASPRKPIQLRLKGGHGNPPAPPRQLQLNTNPFR